MPQRFRICIAALCIAACSFVAGCGLGDYESRMTKRLGDLQSLSRFQDLYGSTEIENPAEDDAKYPITIRLPKQFQGTDWFNAESDYRGTGEKADPGILYPPFMGEFPGLVRMGEQFERDDERKRHSYYAYLGVVETRAMKTAEVQKALRDKVRSQLPTTSNWEAVECPTEDLKTVSWQRMIAKGPQYFDVSQVEETNKAMEKGEFHVYVREDQGYIVIWAVRVPDSIRGKVFLIEQSDAIVGTVKVNAPAPTEPLPKKPAGKDAKPATKKPADKKPTDTPPTEEKPSDETVPEEAAPQETPAKPADEAPPADAPADAATDAPTDEAAKDAPPTDAAKPTDEKPADEPVEDLTEEPAAP